MNYDIELKYRVVLLTGASTGVGRALAEMLYRDKNYKVVITGRKNSIANLKETFLESERFLIRELDLSIVEQISQLVAEIYQTWGKIDILVNNAGVSYRSVVEHMDEASEMEQIRTNYLGPIRLIRYVLPSMRERKSGRIINVSSVSGIMGMPTMASYSASKHALEGATMSLWFEMKPLGISVTLIRPGFINSESYQRVQLAKKAKLTNTIGGPYAKYYSEFGPFIKKFMKLSLATPETVARKIFKAMNMKNPPFEINATPDATLFSYIRKVLPSVFFLNLMTWAIPGRYRKQDES